MPQWVSDKRMIDASARRFLWLCITPVILFLILVSLVPLIMAASDSLREMSLAAVSRYGRFVGLENFITVLDEKSGFFGAMWRTALFVAIVVPVEFMLGLVMALALNREFRSRRIWVTVLLLPTMVAPVVVGLMWDFLLMPEFGLFTWIMNDFGWFHKAPVFSRSLSAFLAIALIDVWEWTPFMMLFMLAGLLGMPQEPIEAAHIDGASPWHVFWHVQLPLLRPMIVVALLFRSIDASKIFETIFVLTNGGPGSTTELISIYAFRTAFQNWELGNAAAVCLVIGFFSVLAASVFYKVVSRQTAKEVA
jgi:multiple sugar transport system permease protein